MSAPTPPPEGALLAAALDYARRGWPVFPLKPRGKVPAIPKTEGGRGFKDATTDPAMIRGRWACRPTANIGLACGAVSGVLVLDVDPRHGGEESLRRLLGGRELPVTVQARTGGGGWHYYFADPGGHLRNGPIRGYPGLDLKTAGGYVVAPPSTHSNGTPYIWADGLEPERMQLAPPPPWLLELIAPKPRPTVDGAAPRATAHAAGEAGAWAEAALRRECEAVAQAQEGTRNETLNRAAFNLGGIVAGGHLERERVEAELHVAADACGLLRPEAERTIRSGLETGMKKPREPKGDDRPGAWQPRVLVAGTPDLAQLEKPNPTDLGNAERFARRHGDRVRWCGAISAWFVWDGKRWAPDRDGEVRRLAVETVRAIYPEAEALDREAERRELARHAMRSEAQGRVEAMLNLAKSLRPIAATLDVFDAPSTEFLLNAENGTIDLRAGALRPHRREDFITKLSPTIFDRDARSEVWDRFLERMVPDRDVRSYLQRAFGYTLTGATSEEVLFFVHGPEAAGKSTFTEAGKGVLGEYARTTDFESFLKKRGDAGVRDDIARLHGARMVLSLEVDEGRALAEGLVKNVTGGDTIAARHLYQSYFEFRPTFKLWLVANHQPEANAQDGALWRRIHLIPFTVSLPEEERDPGVKRALKEDPQVRSAILAWGVQGCLQWQRGRLQAPEKRAPGHQGLPGRL